MDLKRGYALDDAGQLVPPGLTKIVYERNFVMGEGLPTSPAWLQTPANDGSSGSVGSGAATPHQAASPGSYIVYSPATVDGLARLATTSIPMNQYAAIQFDVLGVQLSNTNGASDNLDALISFGVHSVSPTNVGNAGGRVLQRNTDNWARFSMPGVSGDRGEFGASFRTLREPYRFRNMGFLLYCREKQMVYYEDDPANPVGTYDASTEMLTGTVCGALMIQTKTATQLSFRVGAVRLTLWREPETL